MKRKVLFKALIIGILFSVPPVFGQTPSLEGIWIIEKVTVRTIIDKGKPTIKTFDPTKNVDSFVHPPEKIRFTADSVVFYNTNAYERGGTYSIAENTLHIAMPEAPYEYQLNFKGPDKIRFDYVTHYVIDGIHQAEDLYLLHGLRE
jgi:hypothetical protein